MQQSVILNVVFIFGSAIAVIILSKQLRIPTVIGFILTGLFWGAIAPRWLVAGNDLRLLSDLGIVFLLFMAGLDFSPDKVRRLGRTMLVGGSVQALLTVAVALALTLAGLVSWSNGILGAFIVIQSSTSIALKVFQDRGESRAPHAEISVGISLFQDVTTVVLLIFIPLLGTDTANSSISAFIVTGRNLLILCAFAIIAYFMLPLILRRVVVTGVRELIVLLTLVLSLGFAQLAFYLGFSMALGSFLCGLMLNRSKFHSQIIADTAPFRDVFLSLFFISIGLGYDWEFAGKNLVPAIAITIGTMALKSGILFVSARVAGFPFRTSLLTGVGLSNIGEFGFIIMLTALPRGLISETNYQIISSAAIYSMLLTPLVIRGAANLSLRKITAPMPTTPRPESTLSPSRIIIVGFGLAGQHLAQVLKSTAISYSIIESDGRIVSRARSEGEPITFGDAAQWEILDRINAKSAQELVILISDPSAIKACIGMVRRMNHSISIICRTRRMADIDWLLKAGADEVISEEFETSIELFTRVLNRLHVPRNIIRSQTKLLREDGYEMLRVPSPIQGVSDRLIRILAEGTTDVFQVMEEHFSIGKTLQALGLRNKTGVTVITVVRKEKSITNPAPDLVLEAGDSLVIVGSHAQIDNAFEYLESGNGQEKIRGS